MLITKLLFAALAVIPTVASIAFAADPVQTVDILIATAQQLALTLRGTVQDSAGVPWSAQRARAVREDVAHFQILPDTT